MRHDVLLSGGIGNQLFQYAFYCSLKKEDLNARLNTVLYEFNKMHNGYMLERAFGIKGDTDNPGIFEKLIVRFVNKFPHQPLVYTEIPFTYTPDVYKSKALFFKGCWMNSMFFRSIRDEMVQSLKFKDIDSYNLGLSDLMRTGESVSIHIRRGDYLNIPIANVCNDEYYRKAIEILSEKASNCVFYVFSDDPEWCYSFMKQFDVPYRIIEHNKGAECYKDMYLMTQCKHNIIANSTFSWWGAFLNRNKGKVVVAPSLWNRQQIMEYPEKCVLIPV